MYYKWQRHKIQSARSRIILLALIFASADPALARRVAFIVANSAYQNVTSLPNPAMDAGAIARALGPQGLKFDQIVVLSNLNGPDMRRAVERIKRESTNADAVVVYFSGHGMRDDRNRNFLLPVDAVIRDADDIAGYGVDAETIISAVRDSGSRVGLVVLDACRNNPFASAISRRGVSRGLVRQGSDGLNGMLVVYSADAGQEADDGKPGQLSPFAAAFAKRLAVPGQSILQMLDDVADEVASVTGGRQLPTRDGNLKVRAALVPIEMPTVAPRPSLVAEPPVSAPVKQPPAPTPVAAVSNTLPAPSTPAAADLPRALPPYTPPDPKNLSPAVRTQIAAAQQQQKAGNHAGVLSTLTSLFKNTPMNDDESYFVWAIIFNSATNLKDTPAIYSALNAMLRTGRVTPENQVKFLKAIGSMASNQRDYRAATEAYRIVTTIAPDDLDALIAIAELRYAAGEKPAAVDSLMLAIDRSTGLGRAPPESWYRRALGMAYDSGSPRIAEAAEVLVRNWPNPTNWRDVILITRERYGTSLNDATKLDFYRLQSATGALKGEVDYVEYADLALGQGEPQEALAVLDAGIKSGDLNTSKKLINELRTAARGRASNDAARSPADMFFVTRDYSAARPLLVSAASSSATAQTGPKKSPKNAQLRLGMAAALAGDRATATNVLQSIRSGPEAALARLWLIWLK